jgi:hypothetical protein
LRAGQAEAREPMRKVIGIAHVKRLAHFGAKNHHPHEIAQWHSED